MFAGVEVYDSSYAFWPHVSSWSEGYGLPAGDGVQYDKYGMVGEFSKLGTYCHEFGHSLGLIDYYSTSGDLNCGYWELMDTGGHLDSGDHPAHMGAYSKIEMGWIHSDEMLVIEDSWTSVVYAKLFHLEQAGCPMGFYYTIKIEYSSTLYYLVEFRDSYGFDAYLPDTGLLWSKVDLTKGSTEGRLYYLGGDHSEGNYDMDGVELDDTETENGENFVQWLTGTWELNIGAVAEYTDYMYTMVSRVHDAGTSWSIASGVSAGSSVTWSYNSQVAGNIIMFYWDTPFEGSGSDFRIRKDNGGAWTDVFTKDNIWQDYVLYRVTSADNYRVVVINDNAITSMDIYYKAFTCSAPSLDIYNYIGPSSTPYLIEGEAPFTVSVGVTNYNTSWDESVTVSISLPTGVSLAAGETLSKSWSTAYKNFWTYFSWDLVGTSAGTKPLTFTISGLYDSDVDSSHSVTIATDSIDPTCYFTGISSDLIYSNSASNFLDWFGSDSQTGIDYYELYLDEDLYDFYDSLTTSDTIILPDQGNYSIILYGYDKAHNYATDEITIIFDNEDPMVVEIKSALSNVPRSNYILKFNATDNLSGIDEIEIYLQGNYMGTATLDDGLYQILLSLSGYSSYSTLNFEIVLTDFAGNSKNYIDNIGLVTPQSSTSSSGSSSSHTSTSTKTTSSSTNTSSPSIDPLIIAGIGAGGFIGAMVIVVVVKKKKEANFFSDSYDSGSYSNSDSWGNNQDYSSRDSNNFSDGWN
jgi:hypothetical protein